MTTPQTPSERTPDEPRRVSPEKPPADTDLALPVPEQDNPEQLGADGDTHSGTGVPPYRSAYVPDPDDLGNESVGRGADGNTEEIGQAKRDGTLGEGG
jgi:hypothetical protein